MARLSDVMDRSTDFQFSRLLAALGSAFGADESIPEFRQSIPELQARSRLVDGRSAIVPWNAFARALSVGTPSAGGYTAAATSVQAVETLRKYSVLVDGGARVANLPHGGISIASFSTPLSASWLANEGDAVTESDPVVARATGAPKMLATPPVDVSRALIKSAGTPIDAVIANEILTAIGTALDAAAVNGPGTGGAPTGALVASGTISQSGTTLAHTGLVAMLRQVMATGVRRERIRWLLDPKAFATLAGRERAPGSCYIVDGFQACGLPVDVTSGMPDNALLCLDPADITFVFWGGVEVRANPYAAATSGAVRFDCMVGADIVIPVPGRIAKATSIT